jgi:ATP-dependent RNA helicase DDX54/DBP10
MPGVIDFLEDDGKGGASSFGSAGGFTKSKQLGSKSQVNQINGRGVEEEGDDDAAFINAAMNKQNKRAGTEMVKKTISSKGKNKMSSGTISGGGSFQSMGE